MNSTADQPFSKLFGFTQFSIDRIVAMNASTPILLATGGIYTATAKGGTAVVAASQSWTALTGATKILTTTISAAGSDLLSASALYLSLTTAMGSPATADIYVQGVAW